MKKYSSQVMILFLTLACALTSAYAVQPVPKRSCAATARSNDFPPISRQTLNRIHSLPTYLLDTKDSPKQVTRKMKSALLSWGPAWQRGTLKELRTQVIKGILSEPVLAAHIPFDMYILFTSKRQMVWRGMSMVESLLEGNDDMQTIQNLAFAALQTYPDAQAAIDFLKNYIEINNSNRNTRDVEGDRLATSALRFLRQRR